MRTSARCIVLLSALLPLPARLVAADSVTAAANCASNPTCQALFLQAKEASRQESWSETTRLYKAAYEISPDPILLFNIARVLHRQGQLQEAASYYQQFLTSPVNNTEQKVKAFDYWSQILHADGITTPALPVPSPVLEQPEPAPIPRLRPEPLISFGPPPLLHDHVGKLKLEIRSTRIYTKWWFWTLVGAGVAGAATAIGLIGYANTGPDTAGLTNFRPFGS